MAKRINISGGIGYDYTAEDFRKAIENETQDLDVYINSGGGSVYEAFEIYNDMHTYRKNNNAKITAVYNGLVASAASYLSMGATERVANDNSVFMIHNASMMVYGDHRVMNYWKDDLEQTDKVIALAYSKASGKHINEIQEFMSAGTDNNGSYFYGEDIVNNGFANRILESGEELNKENSIAESKIAYVNFKSNLKPEKYDHEKIVAMISKSNSNNTVENNQGEEMKELDNALNVLKEANAGGKLTILDFAKHCGKENLIISEEQKEKLNSYDEVVKLCGDENPTEFISAIQTEKKENAVKVRNAKLTEEFGAEKHETTGKVNEAREFAEVVLNGKELTSEAIEEVKKMNCYVTLKANHADIDSEENSFEEEKPGSKIEKKSNNAQREVKL